MNENTKQELIKLMDTLIQLAYGVMLQTGQETATQVVVAAGKVKEALKTNI
jgi:hypothetical protein